MASHKRWCHFRSPKGGGEDPDQFFGEPGMMLHLLPKGCHIALLATQEAFLESMWVVLVDLGKHHIVGSGVSATPI